MEPAQEPTVKVDSASQKKPKSQIVIMIILVVVALAGLAFGVWGMISKNEAEKKNNLIAENAEVMVDETVSVDGEVADEVVDGAVDTDVNIEAVNPKEYIYIGEWGLKIKIPEELSTVSYEFSHDAGYTQVTIWAVDCSNGKCQYFPEFASPRVNGNGLGSIRRYPKGTELHPGSRPLLIFSDENYDYRFVHPQAVYSAMNDIQGELDWERETVKIVSRMLENAESYSKF